jgi:NAD(P)-dependent dehydrogenase (short-subunit alcohol dehydrogenase family)
VVTGASTGIGRHLVQGLSAEGVSVAGLARGADRLREVMTDVTVATGAPTLAVPADVTDRHAVDRAVGRVLEEFGRIDLLINNAGLMDAAEVPVWQADPDQWWAVVESHIHGSFLLVQAVVPHMVERRSGRVVNLASGLSTRGSSIYSAYSVGKTGLMRLTESLAQGLAGTGVHAFDMAPGVVRTDMTAGMSIHAQRTDWTEPEQVVDLALSIAAGTLDAWSGRLVYTGVDDPRVLHGIPPEDAARQLRLRPYGPADPLA